MTRTRRILTAALTALLTVAPALIGAAQPARAQEGEPTPAGAAGATATVSARLAADLAAADGPVSFLVILREQMDPQQVVAAAAPAADAVADAAARSSAPSAPPHAALLYEKLTAHAAATQAPLRAWLDAQGVAYRPFYIVNMIEVEGDAALVEALRTRPEVARLAANPAAAGVQEEFASRTGLPRGWRIVQARAARATQALPWGLEFTKAPALWAQGIDGSGIVVAGQDTGVQWDHVALQHAYRGWDAESETADHVYNWFDAFGLDSARQFSCPAEAAADPQIPCDDHGHGTHTVGTMVGDATSDGGTLLGMAPGAKFIACRNMSSGVGTPASYTACFQFFLAPHPQDGDPFTEGRPDLAPHIINNSWGCPPSEGCDDPEILRSVVETARAAGQFVAASAGNYGSGCSTVVDPIGIYDAVFTIGAHDSSGTVTGFSSRGPVLIDGSSRLKPDLSAPGDYVYSTMPGNQYGPNSGTSMASPHVAGAVALLWSAAPELIGDIDATEALLRNSATPAASSACGSSAAAEPPNAEYGYGRLNACRAVEMLEPSHPLTVTVLSAEGEPLPNAPVELVDMSCGATAQRTTNAAGKAVFAEVYSSLVPATLSVQAADSGATQLWIDSTLRVYFPYVEHRPDSMH